MKRTISTFLIAAALITGLISAGCGGGGGFEKPAPAATPTPAPTPTPTPDFSNPPTPPF